MGCAQSTFGRVDADGGCIDAKDVEAETRREGRVRGRWAGVCELVNVSGWSRTLVFSWATAVGGRRSWRRRRKIREIENRLWLLQDAPARAEVAAAEETDSVRSSFRFSFGSQKEADEAVENAAAPASTAVLVVVSLEDEGGKLHSGDACEVKHWQWQCLEVLERRISLVAGDLVRFSHYEIWSATRGFAKGRELGRGGLSRVYKGRIGMGRRAVAIKQVEGRDQDSAKAFCSELIIASSLSSSHVVPLLGFCIDQHGLFLVYKYISGGSLDHCLHCEEKNKGRDSVLSWDARYKVAIGVAQAVEYLHFGTSRCIIHRDIKPSNILLSYNKKPKLCDFGLATWTHGPSSSFLCKSVKGTFGYLAPEYFQHGKLSDKTDVYSFGVVLLELITGQKAIDRNRPQGEESLVLWANPLLLQGVAAAGKLIDPRLKPGSYCSTEMSRMIHAATACLNGEETGRPSISGVMRLLQGDDSCTNSASMDHGSLAGCSTQSQGTVVKSDMKSHLTLAMLGVSDVDDD